jgi:integrase
LELREFGPEDGQKIMDDLAASGILGKSSIRHARAFLSGCFGEALRRGFLKGLPNPISKDTLIRNVVRNSQQTKHAYSLPEIKSILSVLSEPTHTVVLTAALTGLRKSELRGLTWGSFDGKELSVTRSVWNKTKSEPKTERSRSPVPVVKQLAEALEAHRHRAGILAQPDLPILQAGNGEPLNLDNLARRVIVPALSRCSVCHQPESEHKAEGHLFERDRSLPLWHGWHAFRRGIATNLNALGIDGKTIQAIMRHSTLALTMNIYVKSVTESQVGAMDTLSGKLGPICSDHAVNHGKAVH